MVWERYFPKRSGRPVAGHPLRRRRGRLLRSAVVAAATPAEGGRGAQGER